MSPPYGAFFVSDKSEPVDNATLRVLIPPPATIAACFRLLLCYYLRKQRLQLTKKEVGMSAKILPFANANEQVAHLRWVQQQLITHMLILTDTLYDIAESCEHDVVQNGCQGCKAKRVLKETV
jgi:hypothetical protein